MTSEQIFKIGRVLANAVTTYDRKQENRRGYNRYALPQYLAAVSRIEESLKHEGVTWQMAVAENFTDRLLTVCVKAIESHPELLAEPEFNGVIGVDLASGPAMTIYTCSKCGSLEQPCEHYEEPTAKSDELDLGTSLDQVTKWLDDELPGGKYFYHYEPATGLEVEVTMRLAGNFAVKLTDTDCEKIIGIKMFSAAQRNEAIAYAKSCVGL